MLLSGGIDSATCLYMARRRRYRLRALTVAFYRMAEGEIAASQALARAAGVVEHRLVNLPDLREAGDIPGWRIPGMPPTYIPQRNSIFYGIAASYAEEVGADYLIGGHNRDDRSIFDDTKDEFFRKLQAAFRAGSKTLRTRKTSILRPLRTMTKSQVIRYASSLKVPLELTWSCHGEGTSHCWRCEGCRGRTRGFEEAGVEDPLRAP